MELTKSELLQKREELKAQLQEIDQELDKENLRDEIETLDGITDDLNTMFQNPILEKHCQDEANVLYEAMQEIDKKVRELRRELGEDDF